MNIYPSLKVRSYVYMGINPITGEFYIGYREWNVRLNKPSHIDLFEYRTSSAKVQPIFDQLNWIILAEFENGNDAFDFEQLLIHENWKNPLLLNKNCQYNGKERIKGGAKKGTKYAPRTVEHNLNQSISHMGQNKGLTYDEIYGSKKAVEIIKKKSGNNHYLRKEGHIDKRKGMKYATKKSTCPHCGKEGGASNMTRWHFNNCRLLSSSKILQVSS